MIEYISRESVLEDLKEELSVNTPMYTAEQNEYINIGLKIAIKDIECLPKADVVEVVRCKDCQHCEHFFSEHDKNGNYREVYYCNLLNGDVKSTDYCSYGERKIDNA